MQSNELSCSDMKSNCLKGVDSHKMSNCPPINAILLPTLIVYFLPKKGITISPPVINHPAVGAHVLLASPPTLYFWGVESGDGVVGGGVGQVTPP